MSVKNMRDIAIEIMTDWPVSVRCHEPDEESAGMVVVMCHSSAMIKIVRKYQGTVGFEVEILVGIELTDDAIPIMEYKHPQQACYLLGAEDNGLSREAIARCHDIVILPGERCLNVAVAGSIVAFDRLNKQGNTA